MYNNQSRRVIGVEKLQHTPYNLEGSEFTAAMWDGGRAGNHDDFNYNLDWGVQKLVSGDSYGSIATHATHVAGTMAGGGKKDPTYTGMAPKSRIITYEWPGGDKPYYSEIFSETSEASNSYNSVLSQNSWGWGVNDSDSKTYNDHEIMGDYGAVAGVTSAYDNITANLSYVNPLSIIFSAGNEGSNINTAQNTWDTRYNTTLGPGGTAKNTITVGAVDDTGDMTSYSSWGPTDDGRIKPTVVADGGCGDDSYIWSTIPGNDYGGICGTSMAAPAVSGAVILLNQQFNRTYDRKPDPATAKDLLIHTAKDLGRPGPDYKFGWGLVNATAAINYINESDDKNLIKRDIIQDTGNSKSYSLTVPKDESVKFTLVWSDYPGTSGSGKALINDLDLVVKNGNGERQYPWTINWSDRTDPAERNMEDHTNVVEQVYVDNTNTTKYTVTVEGSTVNSPSSDPSQDYTLLMTSKETDLVAPNVSVESPENSTYSSVPDFNLSSNESLADARFSIDDGKNLSMQKKNSTYLYNVSTDVTDGFHEAVFWGNDSAGNYDSDSVFFTLDTSKPSVTPLKPEDDANLSSDFNVNATWSDSGTGVEEHNFTVSNSTYSEDRILNDSVSLDNLADGSYTIFYNVTDGAGNEEVKNRSVSVDTEAPEISINTSRNNTPIKDSFETDAVFNDSVTGVDKINISLENSSGIQKSSSTNLTVDTRTYADGYYNITFWANDSAGNAAEKFLNVSFDNSPPELMITSPAENNSEVSTPFDVNATWSDFSDIQSREFEVSNSSGIQKSGDLNGTVTSSDIGKGNYNISYEVSDELGNTVNKTYNISVNIPPDITVHSPESRVYGEDPVFNMSSIDSLSEAFVEVDGRNRSLASGDYFVNNSITLENGSFKAVFYGNDTEGILGKKSVEFTVDKEDPQIEVISPVENANFSSNFSVSASVNDSFSSVESSSFQIFNSSGNQSRKQGLNSTANISGLTDGDYNITFQANDSAGNLAELNRSFKLDTVKPSLEVFKPEENLVKDGFDVNFTANDSGTGLENSSFVLKDSSGDTVLWNRSNRTVDSSGFGDGDYTLEFNASDYAGNFRTSTKTIEFDNTKPVIRLLSPPGENLSDSVDVNVAINDSNFDSSFFRWDKDGENKTSWMPVNQSFDTKDLDDGTRGLFVKANDSAGNENSTSFDFTVDNTKPQIELTRYGYEELDNGWKKSGYIVEAECTDSGTGVKELNSDPTTGDSNVTTNSTSLNATVSGSGIEGVDFICQDYVGNEKIMDDTSQVDSDAPSVESTEPSNGSGSVERSFELSATLHDETVESGVNTSASFLEISGGALENVNWTNQSFTADVSGLDYSESFTVSGNITDYAGLTHEVNLEYTTESDPDSSGDGGGGGGGGGGSYSVNNDNSETANSDKGSEKPEREVEKSEESMEVRHLQLGKARQEIDVSETNTAFSSITVSGSGVVNFSIESTENDPEPPNNTAVYNTVNMDIGGSDNVSTNATFLVSRDWLEGNDLRPEKTSLYRKPDTEWEKLPTTIEEVGSNAFRYRAEIPDFSKFAVATEREECLKKDYSVVEDGECKQVSSCVEPEKGEIVDSCSEYRDQDVENNSSNITATAFNPPEIKLDDITPYLIGLLVLAGISGVSYLSYRWYEKKQLEETLEEIKDASTGNPELIYLINQAEIALEDGEYDKAVEKVENIKDVL